MVGILPPPTYWPKVEKKWLSWVLIRTIIPPGCVGRDTAKPCPNRGCPALRWEEAILRSPALGEQVREKGVNGVFVWADHVAQRLIEVLHYQGVAVPHQVAVVGYNDLASIVENTMPPLSSVNWPIDQVCQWAMEYITQYLTRGSQIRPMKVKIAPELIVRDSSKTTGLAKTLSS